MSRRNEPHRVVPASAAAPSGEPSSNHAQRSAGTSPTAERPSEQELPERFRARCCVMSARETAAQADHRDRLVHRSAAAPAVGVGDGFDLTAGQELAPAR